MKPWRVRCADSIGRVFILCPAVFLSLSFAQPAEAQSASCQFILGFRTLHDLDPGNFGDCVDNQAFGSNGDAQQHTTKGLMAWHKADNWTGFTNGSVTWVNGPMGLQNRLNTVQFAWEMPPAETGSFKIALAIGPAETMLMPSQASSAKGGEVMVQMPGMSMPAMSMMDRGQPVNHHVEAHIYDKSSGAVLDGVMPVMTITNQANGASRKIDPVMAMYGVAEGKSDLHYGGNVYLPDGTYTVTATVNNETATFKDVAVSGTRATAPAPMAAPGMGSGGSTRSPATPAPMAMPNMS